MKPTRPVKLTPEVLLSALVLGVFFSDGRREMNAPAPGLLRVWRFEGSGASRVQDTVGVQVLKCWGVGVEFRNC